MKHTVVALPGMHGTINLFDGIVRERPPNVDIIPIGFPNTKQLTYEQLTEYVVDLLPQNQPVSLLAESFSGPLALKLAHIINPLMLILCATFVRSPVPHAYAHLPLGALFSFSPPVTLLSRMLTRGDESLARCLKNELSMVSPRVLAHRVRQIIAVDVSNELKECRSPVVYIRAKFDQVIPSKVATEFQELKKDTIIIDIEAPHLVLQTAPEKVWDSIYKYFHDAI
jgi:pimeloyl-ACP methyl ester carboxylesterase